MQIIRRIFRFLPGSAYWLIGLFGGTLFCYLLRSLIVPVSYNQYFVQSSFSGVLLSSFIPVILTVVFAYYGFEFLLNTVLLFNGALHGYCNLLLCVLSGHGGWFVSIFTLFAQSCCSALMIGFCSLLLHSRKRHRLQISITFLIAAFVCCLLDYFFISRFYF